MGDPQPPRKQSFWTTAPGVVTAVGGLISAVAALIVALVQIGAFDGDGDSPENSTPTPTATRQTPPPTAPPTTTPTPGEPTETPIGDVDIAGTWRYSRVGGTFEFTLVGTTDDSNIYEYEELSLLGNFVGRGTATFAGTTVHMDGVDERGDYEADLELRDEGLMTGDELHDDFPLPSPLTLVRE